MKKMILLISFILPMVSFAGGKEIKVSVKGMVCGFCAQGIEKKFKAEPAVKKVEVVLKKKLVTLELKDGKDIDNGRIETIIKDAGYDIENIERSK